jgi:hypothetical protein
MLNRAVASRVKLNATGIETLGVLAVVGTTTPTRLASLLAMGTGSMTLVIDRLERAGFVRRVRGTKDRRSLTVEFVPQRPRRHRRLPHPLKRHAARPRHEPHRRTSSTQSTRRTGAELAAAPPDVHPECHPHLYDGVVTSQPAGYRDQHDVIHLGGETAVVVPVDEYRRLRALERRASAELLGGSELFHPGDSSRCTKIGLRLSSCRSAPRG